MRFRRLELRSYGHFEGWQADLPDTPLVVLLGPNEAGKSTLHEGLLDLLFGVPHKSGRTFAFDGNALRLGADLDLIDGSASLERRKGRKDTLEGTLSRAAGDQPLDEAGLARLLELDRAGYEGLFGFGLQHLEQGAELLSRADVATVLAGGSLGGGADGVLALRSRLEAAHQGLFVERGTRRPINETLSRLQAARKATRAASLSRRGFAEAVQGRDRARDAADALQQELRTEEAAHRRLLAQQAARGDLEALAALPEPDPRLLEHAPTIDRLLVRQGPTEAHRATLEEDLLGLDQERRTLATRLDGAWPAATLDQLRRWSGDARLADRLDAAVQARNARSVQRRAQERRRDEAIARREALLERDVDAQGPDDDALRALAAELEQGVERRQVGRRAEDERSNASAALRADRARLQPALPEGWETLALPSPDAVASCAAAEARLADDLRDAQRRHLEAKAAEASLQAELESRRVAAGLPTEADLDGARVLRDSLLDGALSGEDAARARYDDAVAAADALADRLWRGASTAAFLQTRGADRAAAEARRTAIEAELQTLEAERAAADAAWLRLWTPTGIAPGPPSSMPAWLRAVEELRRRADRLAEAERQDTRRTEAQEDFFGRIRALLPDAEDPISALQAEVRQAERRRREAAERAQELGAAEGRIAAASAALLDLDGEDAAADRLHGERLSTLGFEPELSPEGLALRVGALATLADALEGLDKRDRTHRSRQQDVDSFDRELEALRSALGRDAATPLDALGRELAEGRRRAELLDRLPRLLGGSEALAAARDALASGGLDDLDARVTASEQVLDALRSRAADASAQLGEATERFRQLGGAAAADAEAERQEQRAVLERQAEEWAANRLALAVLDRAIERFTRDHQPALLSRTGALMATLTAGRWSAVERPVVGQDKDRLRVVSADGARRLTPPQLSRGTREQLFLALRLAWVAEHCASHEPLPVLADDVLVNFDPARSRQALAAFAELGPGSQTLYLTCQPHLADLATQVGGAVVHLPAPP